MAAKKRRKKAKTVAAKPVTHHKKARRKKASKTSSISRTLKSELVHVIKNLEIIKDKMPGPSDFGS